MSKYNLKQFDEKKITDTNLKEIFKSLKSKVEETREVSAINLKLYVKLFLKIKVEKRSKERDSKSFSIVIDLIMDCLQDIILANNKDVHEKLGAVEAINKLLDINYDDTRKIARCSNFLRNLIANCHNEPSISIIASKTLGKLAKISSLSSKTLTAEFVEFEIKRGFYFTLNLKQLNGLKVTRTKTKEEG
jgi:hypothetical protein